VLFGEAPHRFVAAFGSVPPDVGAIIGARRLGVLGGETIELGSMGSVPLDEAADVWRDAIRRRMRSA
jgi:hypothetical protein